MVPDYKHGRDDTLAVKSAPPTGLVNDSIPGVAGPAPWTVNTSV